MRCACGWPQVSEFSILTLAPLFTLVASTRDSQLSSSAETGRGWLKLTWLRCNAPAAAWVVTISVAHVVCGLSVESDVCMSAQPIGARCTCPMPAQAHCGLTSRSVAVWPE